MMINPWVRPILKYAYPAFVCGATLVSWLAMKDSPPGSVQLHPPTGAGPVWAMSFSPEPLEPRKEATALQ